MVTKNLSNVNPFPLTVPLVAGLLTQMTAPQLARVFGTYHLEVMEAMLKSSSYRSEHLLRKINAAINLILDGKAKKSGQSFKKCSNCKKQKPDVTRRIDPYREEIENKKVYRHLCDDCEKSIKAGI